MKNMNTNLAGRTAVITGGSRGLGDAMATELSEPARSLRWRRAKSTARSRSAKRAPRKAEQPQFFAADVTQENEVDALAESVQKQFGHPQILVNDAGSNIRKNLVDFSLGEFRSVLDTSPISTFLLCRAFVPGMKGSGYGRILNMTSASREHLLSHFPAKASPSTASAPAPSEP